MRGTKKALFTLNVGDYEPDICAITYPYLKHFAKKIGAEFGVINERKFPDWPITFEKFQLYDIAKDYDWIYYVDSDALVHPDMFDPVNHLTPDTVCQYAKDVASHRFVYNDFFIRDGRHIGSCNWFAVAHRICRDVWHYPDDLDPATACDNIYPVVHEIRNDVTREHLIDDYVVSYNLCRYGLKYKTVVEIQKKLGYPRGGFIAHMYAMPVERKIFEMNKILTNPKKWNLSGLNFN